MRCWQCGETISSDEPQHEIPGMRHGHKFAHDSWEQCQAAMRKPIGIRAVNLNGTRPKASYNDWK